MHKSKHGGPFHRVFGIGCTGYEGMLHTLCGVKRRIRQSQSNLAEVGVGDELGNMRAGMFSLK